MPKEKHRKQIREWWKRTARQFVPEEVARIQKAMAEDRQRLFRVFQERSDGGELADCLVRLVANSFSFAHYSGFRRGYLVGVQIGKDEEPSVAEIIQLLLKNPSATTAEICLALDYKGVQMPWATLRKTSRWADVATLPKVKQYISRLRQKARGLSRVQGWTRIMKEHEKRRKS